MLASFVETKKPKTPNLGKTKFRGSTLRGVGVNLL
jgi:hypothetical protein